MKIARVIARLIAGVVLSASLDGCASVGVNVWERDVLSRPEMRPDHQANNRTIDDHIYFSKEAASGGRGFGGGGCGCN